MGFVDIEIEGLPLQLNKPKRFYRVWSQGAVLVEKTADPEFAGCRALQARGVTGKLRTRHVGAEHYSMTMGIGWGACHGSTEGANAVCIQKWAPYDVSRFVEVETSC